MWVSGSRIISIISRSSSTSPPSACEPDLLAELGGKIAHHARQAGEQAVDPLHAGAGDARRESRRCSAETRSNAASTSTSRGASRSRRASSLRASTASETPLIIRSSRSTERRIERTAFFASGSAASRCSVTERSDRGLRRQSGDQLLVILAGQRFAGLQRLDQLADPVDHREHGVDERRVGARACPRGPRPAHPRRRG